MKTRSGYRWRRSMIPALLVYYFAFAIEGTGGEFSEFYPFFNWSLFSNYSETSADVVVYIHEIDGRPLDQPSLYFDTLETLGQPAVGDAHVTKLLDDYYRRVIAGDHGAAEQLIRKFENAYLKSVSSMKYDVSLIVYDPVERYENGAIIDRRVISEGVVQR